MTDLTEGAPAPEAFTEQIKEGLEGALTILALTADVAHDAERYQHQTSILAVMRLIEDLRQRNEEFDPALLDPTFPTVVRTEQGVPRATRVAIARDESCAIYKTIAGGRTIWRTPFYFVYPYVPGSKVRRVRGAEPVNLTYLPDPHKYEWDAPEELAASNARELAGVEAAQ